MGGHPDTHFVALMAVFLLFWGAQNLFFTDRHIGAMSSYTSENGRLCVQFPFIVSPAMLNVHLTY